MDPVYKIDPWISTTPISITPLLRRRERRCLDLTPNPTSRVTFNELNVQNVPDILKTLQNLFDSVLADVTKGIQEEDLVQVTLECPDLDFPIRLPFMQMKQLTSELLLAEIERVLQSNEQFVLDHCVQLNITHVSLPKGGTGKRCDYVDTEKFLKDKRCIIQIQNTKQS